MSSCLMSFAHVSRLVSQVKTRDGNAMTPLNKRKAIAFLWEGMKRKVM